MFVLRFLIDCTDFRFYSTQIDRTQILDCTIQVIFVLIAEFINLYYIDELIPSSKKFCSIYSAHQQCNISAYTIGQRQAEQLIIGMENKSSRLVLNLELIHRYNTN